MIHNPSSQRVAHHVNSCAEPLITNILTSQFQKVFLVSPVQQPVHREDEGHGLAGQPHRLQHHHHGHQPRLGDARRPDARRRGRDGDGENVTNTNIDTVNLSYEEGSNCLVQSCTVLR